MQGPGTPAKGDGESCPSIGRWGSKGPAMGAAVCKARVPKPGGTGSPAEAVVGAS